MRWQLGAFALVLRVAAGERGLRAPCSRATCAAANAAPTSTSPCTPIASSPVSIQVASLRHALMHASLARLFRLPACSSLLRDSTREIERAERAE